MSGSVTAVVSFQTRQRITAVVSFQTRHTEALWGCTQAHKLYTRLPSASFDKDAKPPGPKERAVECRRAYIPEQFGVLPTHTALR